jgi:hypothetical protein
VAPWREEEEKDNAETLRAPRFAERKGNFTTEDTEGTEKRPEGGRS